MRERISVNPGVHFGKPCVFGTRIPVVEVLSLIVQGINLQDIIKDYYPELASEDIQACVQYAIDTISSEEIHITREA
jgi:uncharacterized protein (DUF433 family)